MLGEEARGGGLGWIDGVTFRIFWKPSILCNHSLVSKDY